MRYLATMWHNLPPGKHWILASVLLNDRASVMAGEPVGRWVSGCTACDQLAADGAA